MPDLTKIFLGHGASGNASSMSPWVKALKQHSVKAVALDLPKNSAQKAIAVFQDALARNPDAALGGHSYGGRMASLVAAERKIQGLVLLSYPLHRPGHPEELRTDHWKRIGCPVLLLSGEKDPFAQLPLLHREAKKLKDVTVVTYPKLGHGLLPVAPDVSELIAEFLSEI